MDMSSELITQLPRLAHLEIKQVDSRAEPILSDFFKLLKINGDNIYFHPHNFDQETAHRIVTYRGQDLYYLMTMDEIALGYGLLRGWDEGYAIPSLGIAIHPSFRSQGLSKLFMSFLHVAARLKGAKKIRIKVYPQNITALKLYKQLGYEFSTKLEKNQLVGYINLPG